ncbi:MAG: zinc ribbon domain-containing protein [Bacteroidaceae bacterium]|nr:zinc ribbon domain-containing protein [Bacteroidaceae bacterium]
MRDTIFYKLYKQINSFLCANRIVGITLLLSCFLLTGCIEQKEAKSRYYGDSYNFIVNVDSMELLRFLPSEASLFQDTLYVHEGERVAVADILTSDSLEIQNDTAWVQLVRDEATFGWVEEMTMREQVVPADPISRAIAKFSDAHFLIFIVLIALMVGVYFIWKRYKHSMPLVHFNDIATAYPAVLCVMMAIAATLYATIQAYDFEGWQYFYYHPTINPLAEHGIIALFLTVVWLIIIMAVACVFEVPKYLRPLDTIVYLLGLFAVCCVNYIVFTTLTMYYIGYLLLIVYIAFAVARIMKHRNRPRKSFNRSS